ncbi:MAG: pantetheine-phosphate adenylyltransferase [Bacilli bacterium]|nr:pantetheine-phosphate adenylyltransferase [Bacilli bacterium]
MKKVFYAGSFDPITKGHLNVIHQASNLFDEVVVAVMQNSSKKPFFTLEERVELVKKTVEDLDNVQVVTGTGAAYKLAKLYECQAMIRGLRGVTDFDSEIQLATTNRKLSNRELSTICLFPDQEYQYISSSIVRELFSLDEPIDDYVEPVVEEAMVKKYKR